MAMGEFDLIGALFAPLARHPGAVGLTDDAAFLTPQAGQTLVLTKDAIVEGVHFLADDPPERIAAKLVRVNVSDLVAKGAEPAAALLAAAFPRGTSEDWLRRFAAGLGGDLDAYGLDLMGGDTVATPGPLTLSLTTIGYVPRQEGILRSGARAGDDLWLTGSLGDAALGLKLRLGHDLGVPEHHRAHLIDRYQLPQPRLAVGPRLRGVASAGMDVSDGLVADLGHLTEASAVAAEIDAASLPLSPAAQAALDADPARLTDILTGGDDYEILFTARPAAAAAIERLSAETGIAITRIGRIRPGAGVKVVDGKGAEMALSRAGYRHFDGATG